MERRPQLGELSMRHFADISDVSFQIPTSFGGDMLMSTAFPSEGALFEEDEDEDGESLQRRALYSSYSPHMAERTHALLVANQLTPTPKPSRPRSGCISTEQSSPMLHTRARRAVQDVDMAEPPPRPKTARGSLGKENELPIDDMFERRKRDSYQHKGLDLSPHSTRRARHSQSRSALQSAAINQPKDRTPRVPVQAALQGSSAITARPPLHVRAHSESMRARPPVRHERQATGDHAPAHGIDRARPASQNSTISARDAAPPGAALALPVARRHVQAKPAVLAPKAGILKRRVAPKAKLRRTSAERGSRPTAPAPPTDEGGAAGLSDSLAAYGQKLIASGLAWIADAAVPQAAAPQANDDAREIADSGRGSVDAARSRSRAFPHAPLTLDDLSPRKCAALYELSEAPVDQSPMRPPSKREFVPQSSGSVHIPKRTKEDRNSTAGNSPRHSHLYSDSSRPCSTRPTSQASTLPSSRPPSPAVSRQSPRHKPPRRTAHSKPKPMSLTIPVAPALPGNAHRERVLAKLEVERQQKERQLLEKRCFKATSMPDMGRAAEAAVRHAQAKATVPQEFNLRADHRASQRRAEFDARRQLWQERSEGAGTYVVPDFAAIHAAHYASLAARRRKPAPSIARGPALSTASRAKERERFDDGVRERERILEQEREDRRRIQELEEERAYLEARKKAIPKANEVPAWYADAPKKSSTISRAGARL